MSYYTTLALILFGYMTCWFIVSLIRKRNDVADVAWGLGFVLMAWASFLLSSSTGYRGMIVLGLVSIWGLRLAWHIHKRNKGKGEDPRYKKWRDSWGKWFYLRSYLQVYILQGILLFLISISVMAINADGTAALSYLDAIGILVWLIGFFFEVVGDAQLAAFIKDKSNKGKIMQSGLWAYTRHPNYFGEVACWWGIWIMALNLPKGYVTIISPLVITFLILKVSGIPMLEKHMAKKEGFEDYKKRVSKFFPMPPKK